MRRGQDSHNCKAQYLKTGTYKMRVSMLLSKFVRRNWTGVWIGIGLLGFAVTNSCTGDTGDVSRILSVPTQYSTVQEAVDAARSGDIVEISPGVYNESIKVETDNLVIRGLNRNTVIFDGGHQKPNGFLISADGVSVQNLTVHSYTQNGVVFNGAEASARNTGIDSSVVYGTDGNWLDGFYVSHITSYNNGLYGIYAFASTNGIIEDSYVSGHPDSGIYVGQCSPCNTVVQRVVADLNAIGYYGTNASGNVYVIDSVFSNNRIGIAPNSQKAEKLSPQSETFVVGNRVVNNDNPMAPRIPKGAFGLGIAVGGGTKNLVARNLVTDHDGAGIVVMALGEFDPENNRVEENVTVDNEVDLAFADLNVAETRGNCFTKNTFSVSLPKQIEEKLVCGKPSTSTEALKLPELPAPLDVDYKKIPAPGDQATLSAEQLKQIEIFPRFVAPNLAVLKVPTR